MKQWDAALDSRTRLSHAKVDGEVKELEETFSNGLLYPGDPSGSAAEVINCRCVALSRARWALDESELQELKERAEFFGLDKTESFEEFKEKYLKAVENSENDDIISSAGVLTHRKTSSDGREIIDQATYHKLTNPVKQKGGMIITASADNGWVRYLEMNGATAVTYDDAIIFRPDATITEVLEETYHFYQNRSCLNNQYTVDQRRVMNEILAQEYVLGVADRYKIPKAQREETKALLEAYKEERERMREAGEWID